MVVPNIRNEHDPETRNIINHLINEFNGVRSSFLNLIVNGQLTPGQFAELLNSINTSAPQGAFNTLSDLQSAYPNGADGIYVVTENGEWYFWNDGSWQSGGVYQSTQWQNALTKQNESWVV